MIVYADILFVLNLFITYFLLLASAKLYKVQYGRFRLLGGAAIGGLYSMIIFFDGLHWTLSILLRAAVCCLMILASFKLRSKKQFLRLTAVFLLVNFAFAGIMMAIWLMMKPQGMYSNYGVAYFNISPIILIGTTVICYFIVTLLEKLLGKRAPKNHVYELCITHEEKTIKTTALLDTGNHLQDPFSHLPVVIINFSDCRPLLPKDIQKGLAEDPLSACTDDKSGMFRLIPYHAVGTQGVLPAFRPDSVTIKGIEQTITTNELFLAVTNTKLISGSFGALLNPDLFAATQKG